LPESRKCLGKIQIFQAQNPIFLTRNPIVFTRKLIFLNGFMSFLNGFPRFFDGFPIFAFGFLLSATPFYFPQRFAAFRKGFLIFLKGFPIFLDGFPLSEKSEKIYLWWQVYKRLLFKLPNSLPLCSLSFVIATRSSSVIIATTPTSHPTKAIRMSRCKFGGINISPANFTPMKKYFSHVIIAILLLFLHKYHVFALIPSSLIHIVVLKISQCNIS
jgi:hypothetical protein